jgi:hypothetical protein
MLVFPSSAIAWKGQLYHAAADSFAAAADMPVLTWPQPGLSSDDIAAYWLVGNQLLSGSLTPLQVLGGGSPLGVASVLSADGTLAYVAVPEGVAVYRTADGAEIERVYLPESPFRLLVAPDGSRLFGLAAPGFMVVDLR